MSNETADKTARDFFVQNSHLFTSTRSLVNRGISPLPEREYEELLAGMFKLIGQRAYQFHDETLRMEKAARDREQYLSETRR